MAVLRELQLRCGTADLGVVQAICGALREGETAVLAHILQLLADRAWKLEDLPKHQHVVFPASVSCDELSQLARMEFYRVAKDGSSELKRHVRCSYALGLLQASPKQSVPGVSWQCTVTAVELFEHLTGTSCRA